MNKKLKTLQTIFATALLVIGICTLITGITKLAGIELPVVLTRIFGVLEIISCPLMVYSGISQFMQMAKDAKELSLKKSGKGKQKKAAEAVPSERPEVSSAKSETNHRRNSLKKKRKNRRK